MDKSSLRKQMIKARLDLDSVNYTTKSNFIISKLKQHPDFIKAKTIGIYVSFRNEVNTISLIKEMLSNKNICVPKIEDKEIAKKLIQKIFNNNKMPYISITPTFSICQNHGYIAGEHFECPECGEKTEVWSRVVGYLRMVQDFNDSKREEYDLRKKFVIKEDQIV